MRRIILALFAMTAGTTLLVGLKSQGLGLPFQLVAEGPVDPADGGVPGTTGDTEPTTGAGPTTDGAVPDPTAGATPAPGASTTTAAPATTAAQPPPPPPGVSGTFSGGAVAVRTAQSPNTKSRSCGDCHDYSTAVTITVSNGKITNVSVSYNTSPGRASATRTRRPTRCARRPCRLRRGASALSPGQPTRPTPSNSPSRTR